MEDTNQKKKMLLAGIIITAIVFVVVLVILLILMAQENAKVKIKLGNDIYKTKEIGISTQEGVYHQNTITYKNQELPILLITPDGTEYFCIETLATLAKYTYNNGAYGDKVDESRDKCYIDNGGEYVTFISESDTVSKTLRSGNPVEGELKVIQELKNTRNSASKDADEESFKIDHPVIRFEDKLYAPYQAINKGFNMIIRKNGNIYEVFTLERLVAAYKGPLSEQGFTLTTNFKNQRALALGYAVVSKNSKYGAVAVFENNKSVLSQKYDAVEFVQSIEEFVVLSNSKFGMASPKQEILTIPTKYEDIKLLSAEKKLYIVKDKSKYGVLNTNGETVIPTEYDQIGLSDVSVFSNQDITDKYLIAGCCIPIKKNGVFGFYNIDEKILEEPRFIELGCRNPSEIITKAGGRITTDAMPTLTIPLSDEITGIIFGMKNAAGMTTYGVITTKGTVIQNAYFTAIYYIVRNGNIKYYFNKPSNNEIKTLEELIRTREDFQQLINQAKDEVGSEQVYQDPEDEYIEQGEEQQQEQGEEQGDYQEEYQEENYQEENYQEENYQEENYQEEQQQN